MSYIFFAYVQGEIELFNAHSTRHLCIFDRKDGWMGPENLITISLAGTKRTRLFENFVIIMAEIQRDLRV